MIAPQQEEILRVFDLISEHEADGLDGLFPPIDIVAQKEVVSFSGKPCILEELDEVWKLTVDIACVGEVIPQILMGA